MQVSIIVVIVGAINPNLLREELDKSVLLVKLVAALLMISGTFAASGVSFS